MNKVSALFKKISFRGLVLLTAIVLLLVLGGTGFWYRSRISTYVQEQIIQYRITSLESAVKNDPSFAVHKKDFEEAVRQTIEQPNETDRWLALGALQYNLNDNAGAEKSLLKAQQLAPHAEAALWNLVQLYVRLKKYSEAEKWAKFALTGQPWDKLPEGYIMLGDLYENHWTEKSSLAGDIYLQGWRETSDLHVLQRLAAYWRKRDVSKAITYYQELISQLDDGPAKSQLTAELRDLTGTVGN